MIIIEENFNGVETLNEAVGDRRKFYLRGVFAEAETKNRNQRSYPLSEMKREVEKFNEAAKTGKPILGELDHPETLEIKLKNVSHKILEMKMQGNQVIGKAELLENHPNGQIAIGLMKDGIQLGVSTRGSGKMRNGIVENYNMVTVDIVATPSARNAYPETLREQLEMAKNGGIITDLAEGMANNDPIAQKYFQSELRKFIREITSNNK
tara:strand:- start:285 stop:911 length:627 start_codon:yes stop_codon:yes gene_type:complete